MATTLETKTLEETKASKSKKTARKSKAKRPASRALTVVKNTPKKTARKASKTAKKAVKKTAAFATKSIDNATRAATAPSSKMMNDAAQQFTSLFQQTPFKMETLMNNKSFPQFDQIQSQMQTAANEATAMMTKAQAVAEKSTKTFASGMEECGKTMASMMQASMQRANDAVRALSSCRTIQEYADIQTKLSKQNFDAMSTETAKLVEQMTKTMTAAAAPVGDLASEAMSKAKKSMAA